MNDKTTPSLPSLPSIASTDSAGVHWEFEPNKKRWSATVDGKKMSSGELSKLKEKVEAALKPVPGPDASTPALPQRQFEVAMIAVSAESIMQSPNLNLLKDKVAFSPILVKMEWNATKAAMEVVRYKNAEKSGESGWKNRNSDNQILFHPSAMPDAIADLLDRSTRSKMVTDHYRAAEGQVGQAWWQSKTDQTQAWEMFYNKGISQTPLQSKPGNSESVVHTNPDWLRPDPDSLLDHSQWTQADNGDLQRGPVSIKMALPDRFYPAFTVCVEGWNTPFFSGNDLEQALILGNATHFIRSQPESIVTEWAGTSGWDKNAKNMSSWPTRRQVHGAALFAPDPTEKKSYQHYPKSFVLAVDVPETMSPIPLSSSRASTGLEWKPANSSYFSPSFRNAGPEDAALQPLVELRSARDAFEPDPFNLKALEGLTPGVLADIAGKIEDGEEFTNDLGVMAKQMQILLDRAQARHAKAKDIVQWSQRCTDTVQKSLALIEKVSTPEAVSRKPKP